MSEAQPPIIRSLIAHDGELDEVRVAFVDLGIPFVEHRSDAGELDPEQSWDLVVATPNRLISLVVPREQRSIRIAVTDHESRTLRSSLHRAEVDLVVRRPVHPAVLRGLILHGLYRGSERRRTRRVGIGAPVRYRLGWSRPTAVLADLSMGGCRLLLSRPFETGRAFTLRVPEDLAGGRPFTLRARPLHPSVERDEEEGSHVLRCRFESLTPYQSRCLRKTVARYRAGPARYAQSLPEALTPAGALEGDRRTNARQPLDERVVDLNAAAARILMGRDVSLGGMRVEPNPRLRVGDDVRLAIHLEEREQPLLIDARVHRDDGDSGLALRFHQLDPEAIRTLRRRLESPPVMAPGGLTGETRYVLSEIVERQQA
ncbi:MAG: PilZ domain-containing protein [Myxococcales bacterium]|nr:PilZ domain-containing protein [Myxococcales bacterium]